MTLEQLFQRYCIHVHPLFWPVLWLSLQLYQRRKAELYARGCQGLLIEIRWWGAVTITGGLFPDADPGWKAHLYAANGAYAALTARPLRPVGAIPPPAGEEGAQLGYLYRCAIRLSGLTKATSAPRPPHILDVPARPGKGALQHSRDGPAPPHSPENPRPPPPTAPLRARRPPVLAQP